MKILLFGRKIETLNRRYVLGLVDEIATRKHELWIYTALEKELELDNAHLIQKKIARYEDLIEEPCDILISLGGDGTILKAATIVKDLNIPILGINLGRLGFLSNLDKTNASSVIGILEENLYELDRRSMLKLNANKPIFEGTQFALNDFTILKRDNSSMITIHTYVNGSFLNTYWADGIIVATPTGSTGYSLSCGGPILFPSSKNFVITPVAPHNLTARPVVIPDDSILTFEVEGRSENFLCTLDSRFEVINSEFELEICKSEFQVSLVRFQNQNFSKTIREKLNWGVDSRN